MMRTAMMFAFMLSLAACGQSGDLYLPGADAPAPKPAEPLPPPPAETAPGTEKKKDAP